MKINKIASGSAGNAIELYDGSGRLLLDAGIAFSKLSKKTILTHIDAILISHEHLDHSRAIPELLRRGFHVYMSRGTAEALGVSDIDATRIIEPERQIQIGDWLVVPFPVEHDAAEPMGFLIESLYSSEKLIYVVDTCRIDYDFKGITHWLVECNFSEDLLKSGTYKDWLKERVKNSHMSLENLVTFLTTSDMTESKEIHLLHLSDANSDEKKFVDFIQRKTGIPTYAS